MKRVLLIACLIACYCVFGCTENNGDTTFTTGGANAESTVEDSGKVEQSQLDELLPLLVCTECDIEQIKSTGRMYDVLVALATGQAVLPDGQYVDPPLTQPQINIAIEAYSESVSDLVEGADTMTIESDFNDQIEDLLDDSGSQTQTPAEVVA